MKARQKITVSRCLSVAAAMIGLAVLLPPISVSADGLSYKNPPSLDRLVMAGRLPPVAERLPEMPHVTDPTTIGRGFGRSGGKLTMLMARDKDLRQMVVYGYARLVHYTDPFDIKPGILRDI